MVLIVSYVALAHIGGEQITGQFILLNLRLCVSSFKFFNLKRLANFFDTLKVIYGEILSIITWAAAEEYLKLAITYLFVLYGLYDYSDHGQLRSAAFLSPSAWFAAAEFCFYLTRSYR